MEERRSLTRLRPYFYLRVYEVESEEMVGSAYDLTQVGMRVVANRTFKVDDTYRLALLLPADSFFGKSVKLDALCKWCKGASETNSYDCGFEFVERAGAAVAPLMSLIKDLEEQGRLSSGRQDA